MKGESPNYEEQLSHVIDALVNDILSTSDEDVLAEAAEEYGDAQKAAKHVDELISRARAVIGRRKLAAARSEMKTAKQSPRLPALRLSLDRKKHILQSFAQRDENLRKSLTMAARNEKQLTEADYDAVLEALYTLGAIDEDGNPR